MDCRVVVEAAVPVYDVESQDEAVRVAISKAGDMLNPDLNYVEIDVKERKCQNCGKQLDPAFIAADEGLVALELEMRVFNVESEEHASRVARKEIGEQLPDIPLSVQEVEQIGGEIEEEQEEIGAEVEEIEEAKIDAGEEEEDIPELEDIL